MSFSVDWLRQREPYDHAARSRELAERFAAAVGDRRVLDLGGGAGSGARYLRQVGIEAVVVDHDPALLEVAASSGLQTLRHDLRALDWPAGAALHCQALLDLVSWDWLQAFVARLKEDPVPVLAALTVDGRVRFDPEDADDDWVMTAFRAHQRLDRGFGPSPGPRAAHVLAGWLKRAGWTVTSTEADWQIPASDEAMVHTMVAGIVDAASVMVVEADAVVAWGERRAGAMMVGHRDVLALPPSPRRRQ